MELKDVVVSTPIHRIKPLCDTGNEIYVKRDDLQPFSFGGNKVRIGQKILLDMIKNGQDCLITYGNRRSNLARVTTNLCCCMGIPCYMISVIGDDHGCDNAFNGRFCDDFGAKIIRCEKDEVPGVVSKLKAELKKQGHNPHYIKDDDSVTAQCIAYKEVYRELEKYQEENGISFDYIFSASGSGTTQCGLIIGKLTSEARHVDDFPHPEIIGISTARTYENGVMKLKKYLEDYFKKYPYKYLVNGDIDNEIHFVTDYLCGGYGDYNEEILSNCRKMMSTNGFELDPTYTGKAYTGMEKYLAAHNIKGKKVLFIHTGGTPLYFDLLNEAKQ